MYGHFFLRIIHFVVEDRARYLEKWILLKKVDYKYAYHHVHFNCKTAIHKIMQVVTSMISLIPLRMNFVGSAFPK